MNTNKKFHRRSIRLKNFDYTQAGVYFITIRTVKNCCIFGEILDGEMFLNDSGKIVESEWLRTLKLRNYLTLDQYIVMPNHFHGILIIKNRCGRGTAYCALKEKDAKNTVPTKYESFGKPISDSIPTIIRSFKSAVTKGINFLRNTPAEKVWKRNYYEHIIRNYKELENTRQYIIDNPANWFEDKDNPLNC